MVSEESRTGRTGTSEWGLALLPGLFLIGLYQSFLLGNEVLIVLSLIAFALSLTIVFFELRHLRSAPLFYCPAFL